MEIFNVSVDAHVGRRQPDIAPLVFNIVCLGCYINGYSFYTRKSPISWLLAAATPTGIHMNAPCR
jgi:hypothetical protein